MENRLLVSLFILLFLTTTALADDKITISGYVKSGETGEELIGSTVYVEELKIGTATNTYGFYSLALPKGRYTIRYSYIGYESTLVPTEISGDLNKNVELQPASTVVDEIVVSSDADDKNIREATMGVAKLSPKETSMIPGLWLLTPTRFIPIMKRMKELIQKFSVRAM